MKRMIFSKRSLALMLALMMTLSVVYVPAFAVEAESAEHVCDFSGEPIVVSPDHESGKAGYTYYECQVEGCDKVKIDPDSIVEPGDCKGEHKWVKVEAVEPTCETKGNVEYKYCSVCGQFADKDENLVDGDETSFEIDKIAHKMTEWSLTTYNCTDLFMTRECLMCGTVESVEWTENEHTLVPMFDAPDYKAPTCTTPGKVTFACTAAHTLDDGTVIECSKTFTATVPPTQVHKTTLVPAVDPTCTTAGNIEYHLCDMCGAKVRTENAPVANGTIPETEIVIAALDHEWGEFKPVEGYVCGAANNMVAECEREGCDEKKYETRNHNYLAEGTPEVKIENCVKTTTTKTKCEHCGDVQTDAQTEVAHEQLTVIPAVAATCVADGKTAGEKCEKCGVVTKEQEVVTAASVVASHKSRYVAVTAPKPATCTQSGTTAGEKCPVCNVVVTEPAVRPAKGHAYNETKIEATCQQVGYEIGGICSTCGEVVEGKVIPKAECTAKAEDILVSEANCKSPAIYKSECKWCNAVLNSNIPKGEKNATNHIGTFAVDVAASEAGSCLTNGFAYATCTECEVIIMVIPNGADKNADEYKNAAYDHKPVTVWMTETEFNTTYPGKLTFVVTATGHKELADPTTVENATCTNTGLKTWVCGNEGCNHVIKTEVIPATGHDESDGYVTTQNPTCTAEGVATLTCKTCGVLLGTKAVAALGHKKPAEYEVITAPTCTSTGIGRYFCENECGTQIDADVVIPALVHEEGDGVTTPATCKATGKTVYSCKYCGIEMRVVVIPTVAHDYEAASTTATCTTDGITTYTCKYSCGSTYTEVAPATGHAYNTTPDADSYAATCYAEGLKKWTCTNECGHVEEEVLPMINHTLERVDYDMTCQAAGYSNWECTVEGCGYTELIAGSEIPVDLTKAEAHSFKGYSAANTVASCATAEGVYVKKCEHCDTTAFTETVKYDTTKGHGTLEVVNGELVYVPAYTDKNVSVDGKWTYVEHVSNKCEAGVVGGYRCEICKDEEVLVSEFADKKVGDALEAVHNLTASAKAPSCEGLGEQGWTYHEYCEDCDYGHTPDDTWEYIPCTPCTTVTVPAVAHTCKTEGYGEYTYCPCHATKAEIEALKAAVVVPAANHAGTKETRTYAATCTEAGFEYTICTACNDYLTVNKYLAPLGHTENVFDDVVYNAMVAKYGVGNFTDGRAVVKTCSVDGKTAGTICAQCLDLSTFVDGQVIASEGHTNAAGEHFFDGDSCKDVAENADRFCTVCNETIAVKHRVGSAVSHQATCQAGEYNIEACVDCNEQNIIYVRDAWTEEEHKAAIMGNLVDSKPATPTEYGVNTYKCPHCDETIKVEVPLAEGVEFELDYSVVYPVYDANGNITGFTKSSNKETANGTWIAVDVLVYGNKDVKFSQIDMSFTFNNNVVFWGSLNETAIENLVVESVVPGTNIVKIDAGVAHDAEEPYVFVNTIGSDAEGVVLTTVYFMVKPEAGVGEVQFAFGNDNRVYLVDDGEPVDITMHATFSGETVRFESDVLGDVNNDGVIDGIELLIVKQMLAGKLDVDYDVTLDLNKDGSVTVIDYAMIKELVNVDNVFEGSYYNTVASK